MKKAKKYIVQTFNKATNDWTISEIMDWENSVDGVLNEVLNVKGMLDNSLSLSQEYKDEVVDAMENGRNWCIGEYVIGITCINPKDCYDDVVILIQGIVLDENDIKAIKIPFESYEFLCGYMERTCEVFGGKWKVCSVDDYFENKDNQFNGNYHAVIKTKVKYNHR